MIFLRRLSLRPVRSKKLTGGITVWLALCFLVFLSLYQVCLKSVWKQFQRQRAEQAAQAGAFSLLSEYEPHLLQEYDLFYLDSSFGSGTERQDEICSHLWKFVDMNLKEIADLEGIHVTNLERATDGEGMVFYRQAVQVMKEKTGAALAEDWLLQELFQRDMQENSRRFQEDCEYYEGTVVNYDDEEDEVEAEAWQWDGLRNSFTLAMAVPGDKTVSSKIVSLEDAPSQRELSLGAGRKDGTERNILEKQWFISYLCEYLKHAQEMMSVQRQDGYLDYQLEYIIGGKASDGENLEVVIRELLLMREGANYVFLLSHPEYEDKAELLAVVLAGLTGNEGLIKGVKHLILLGWAYGESLVEVRQLLGGYELSAVKSSEDWQVPLSGLLSLIGNPGKYDAQAKRQDGMNYEACLRILLMLKSPEDLAMRALDIVEGELQQKAGCENLHMDHCIGSLTAQIWLDGMYLERDVGYE